MIKSYNNFVFEKVGVNDDVIKLSNFISKYIHLKGKVSKEYVINKKDLPDDINLPINKLVIYYEPIKKGDKNYAYLDVRKSKRFKSGNVEIYIVLRTLKKSIIYHEINHALQFINLGKYKMIRKGKMSILYNNIENDFKDKKVKSFLYLLYRSDELEVSSNIIQFYGQLKGLMKKYIKDFKIKFKDKMDNEEMQKYIDKWKKKYFINTLKNRDIYRTAKIINNIDLFEYFENADKDEVIKLFTLLSFIDKNNKIIKKSLVLNPIDDNELEKEIQKYQNMMNNMGRKMLIKIGKVWDLLNDIK